jgi:rhamnulose-1-phosphate aldolase
MFLKSAQTWIESAEHVAHTVASLGWAPGTGGNLSVDLGRIREPKESPALIELAAAVPGLAGHTLLITRSGCRFRDFSGERDVGFIRPLSQGDRAEAWFPEDAEPTFEIESHLAIHAAAKAHETNTSAVLHIHPPHLIALTQVAGHREPADLESALLGTHPEVPYHLNRGIGIIPYSRSGTSAIVRRTAEHVALGATAVVWGLHGCLTLGADLEECLDRAELIEGSARIRIAALSTGLETTPMTAEQIAEMRGLAEHISLWREGGEL